MCNHNLPDNILDGKYYFNMKRVEFGQIRMRKKPDSTLIYRNYKSESITMDKKGERETEREREEEERKEGR
jgi:hypothetical protein